jgi:hypothetical protein
VEDVGSENEIEVPSGEIQARQGVAHGQPDCLVILPCVMEKPPGRGDHPGRSIHCPDHVSFLHQHGDVGPGAASDIQDPRPARQRQAVPQRSKAPPEGQALRMEQESVYPGDPVENPDSRIGRKASARVAGHWMPILRQRAAPGKAND